MKAEIVQMRLFDLGNEIDLPSVHQLLGQPALPSPVLARSATPASSKFPQPVEVVLHPQSGPPGATVELRAHAIGAVVVRIRWPVEVPSMAALASAANVTVEGLSVGDYCRTLMERARSDLGSALHVGTLGEVMMERYIAYCVLAPPPDVAHLLGAEAKTIAQLISGAPGEELVPARMAAAHKHTMQYTPGDAVVIGWDHAVILDEPGEYEDVLDVMELANLELLEFRAYDAELDLKLESSFKALDRLWAPGGLFRSARTALRDVSKLRVEFARLTDNLHDTGKIFGDWYMAQLHQRLQERFHMPSWETAVAAKMATLEDMFHLAQEEANHRRSLVLEVLVVLLFVLDLVLLLRVG